MRILKNQDVVALLRAEIERAGGVAAWARKAGMSRTSVSKVLSGVRQPPRSIIKALKLRTVFVADSK